jgi:MFS family permease
MAPSVHPPPSAPTGLRENWRQFGWLVLVNGFVGAMIGLERTVVPSFAETSFGIQASSAVMSFLVVFGLAKSVANYFAGSASNRWGRKRLLMLGWALALPVPAIMGFAPHWGWVLVANGLLGLHQGFAWSSTVVMKIDLVGERRRGLAMGWNESAGYLAVAAMAWLSGVLAAQYGSREVLLVLGSVVSVSGLLTSWIFVRDTRGHVRFEASQIPPSVPLLRHVFRDTTWRDRNLGAVTQAGLVNNLNDGMMWGLLPVLLATKGFSLAAMAPIVAIYPMVGGLGQFFTGSLADRFAHRHLLTWGMGLQAVALGAMVGAESASTFLWLGALLGLGTALVYPTFLVAIASRTRPEQRAESIGVFRLWRDLGYVIGALITGAVADQWGIDGAVASVAAITLFSTGVLALRMR